MALRAAPSSGMNPANMAITGGSINNTSMGGATPAPGSFTTIAASGTITPNSTAGVVGTTTNDSANAGSIGQFVSSLVAVGAPVSLSNATPANVTSISLTAGDWDVEGNINFSGAVATITGGSGGISSTSATLPTDGSEAYDGTITTLLSATSSVTLPRKRISLSGTTTVYLVASKNFSAGTVGAFGAITARRVR